MGDIGIQAGCRPGPVIPDGALDWKGWQFSADYNGQGPHYGTAEGSLDLNIVKTDVWQRWTGQTGTPPRGLPRRL